MEIVSLILAIVALVLAFAAWARAGAFEGRVNEIELQARRRVENAAEETEQQLATLRQLLAVVVAGGELTPEMVLEGRLWNEVDGAGARELVTARARVLDVRTPAEVETGKIPGAICIPIDELEERCDELEASAQPTLVYCAGGGRSAAACEFLSQRGLRGLHNLEGGVGTWPGELVRG